ncbi:MAG: MFS transporter [Kordiimonadaceae bacterium]|jgi:MFS family permease|nr:MFS transporter [Kordiimonadaceae bacterium]MBT6036110.1 MFS transporter [Kordiimonadaceae bacterium]MBT6330476.1 MFS transporter [Kordiimonadaceae bacterium]
MALASNEEGMQDIKDNWRIILAAGLCLFFMFGVPTFMFPWIYREVIAEFDWSRAQATDVISVKFLVGALCAILIGWAVDKFGPRKITILACLIGGSAMLSFTLLTPAGVAGISAHNFYMMLGGFLGLSSLGIMISTKTLLGRMFEGNMGTALGLALVGTSLAGAATPFLFGFLKDAYGWREAIAILSMGIWFVALPFYIFSVREEIGGSVEKATSLKTTTKPDDAVSINDFLKGRNFWLIVIGLPLIAMVDMGVAQHYVLYMSNDLGLDITMVRTGATIMAIIAAAAKVGFGRLYDKTSTKGIAFTYILLGFAVLLLFPVEGFVSMMVCLAIKGTAHGGLVVDVPVATKHCYGAWGIGKKIAIFTMVYGFGLSGGPRFMGMIYDTYGSYTYGFITLICLSIIAAILMYFVKPDYWLKTKAGNELRSNEATQALKA